MNRIISFLTTVCLGGGTVIFHYAGPQFLEAMFLGGTATSAYFLIFFVATE